MAYFVYILQSEKDGSYYIGHTSDLERRVERHNQGRSGYTKGKLPWKLVYHEAYDSKGQAMIREREIKDKRNRQYILGLVRTSQA
jgi:putative endonuclease